MSGTARAVFNEEFNAVIGNETCKVKPGFAVGILVALIIITILTVIFIVRMSRMERFVNPSDMQYGVYFANTQRASCPPHIVLAGDARRMACCI